jgi:hypothetical protein
MIAERAGILRSRPGIGATCGANFDDAAIKSYLVLDHMIDAFDCATCLFITFAERKDVPVWHPDVRVWEVKDAKGRHKRRSTATTLLGRQNAPAPG